MLKPGSQFAGYEILEVTGKGAMATTYRARSLGNGRPVALKVPSAQLLTDPTFVVRFLQEAHLGKRLDNRFIVRTYDAGDCDGIPYIAMEYLEGMTLKDGLAASGRLALRGALKIARDVSEALEHAHSRSVIHRDLKPDNIMLRAGRCLKVHDFGIAKVVGEVGLTSANVFIGSPAYAAPEMIDSSTIDHRADLYSLGIILYEMVEGEPPFSGRSPFEVLMKHQTESLPESAQLPQPLSRDLWRLIKGLTAKKPADRLPDARSVRIALEMLIRS